MSRVLFTPTSIDWPAPPRTEGPAMQALHRAGDVTQLFYEAKRAGAKIPIADVERLVTEARRYPELAGRLSKVESLIRGADASDSRVLHLQKVLGLRDVTPTPSSKGLSYVEIGRSPTAQRVTVDLFDPRAPRMGAANAHALSDKIRAGMSRAPTEDWMNLLRMVKHGYTGDRAIQTLHTQYSSLLAQVD